MNLSQYQIDKLVQTLLKLIEGGVDIEKEIEKIKKQYEKGNVK